MICPFAERHFAVFLQTRNPNVPGVVNKLRAPTERQLKEARQLYEEVVASSREGSPLFEAAAIRSLVLRRDLPAGGPDANLLAGPESSTNPPPAQAIVPSIPAPQLSPK